MLVRQSISEPIAIEFLPSAVKCPNRMIASEFFNPARSVHRFGPAPKNPGSLSSRSIRGNGRGGASSAVRNNFQSVALLVNDRRSARVSSAREGALQYKLANGAMDYGSRRLQSAFCIACQAQIKFFTAGCAGWHPFLFQKEYCIARHCQDNYPNANTRTFDPQAIATYCRPSIA